ncbi:MAG: ATP-dependent Clp protease proteolytic subunit [Clostridia bacterium]|nr:ATP-dependent Clp protease proteolytic subunit [Clostridia bacterium]
MNMDEINNEIKTEKPDDIRPLKGVECITVSGQVEGHYSLGAGQKATRYEELIPRLVECEQSDDVCGVLFLLNTVGGDVEAGLAIAELIASMSKPTVSLVLGGGHSIGVPLAVAAKRSFIVPSATMTIHPVRYNGLVLGVEQSFTYFKQMQDRINGFIVAHSKIDGVTLKKLMFDTDELASDMGTIIDGEKAVSYGLIDEIGGIKDALGWLKRA